MKKSLDVLFVDDSECDVELLVRELQRGGYEPSWMRVETAHELGTALRGRGWEIVISDWMMPRFGGLEAFEVLRESELDLPFIIVSGAIGEELAVDAMRAGVQDFILKQRLTRLVPAVDREVRELHSRKARRAVERQLEEIRREVEGLEREKVRAQRESQFKSRFLANMSHELRTPLNAIIGFSELLDERLFGPLTETQEQYVQNVIAAARYLLNLINDILDLSKIEAGRVELRPEPVAFGAVLDSVQSIAMPLAIKQGVELELSIAPELPELEADPLRLKQILYNLLSNGIKFTPRGGRVQLEAEVSQGQLCIQVVDTGIGIRKEDLPRLFHDFERIEPTEGLKPEGTGLGLSLTRRLVELHGGTVSVESRVGAGSTFRVTLPVCRGVEAAGPPAPPSGSALVGQLRHVLGRALKEGRRVAVAVATVSVPPDAVPDQWPSQLRAHLRDDELFAVASENALALVSYGAARDSGDIISERASQLFGSVLGLEVLDAEVIWYPGNAMHAADLLAVG